MIRIYYSENKVTNDTFDTEWSNTEGKKMYSTEWPVIDYIQIICISYLFFLTWRIIKIEVWIALEIKARLVMQRNKVE